MHRYAEVRACRLVQNADRFFAIAQNDKLFNQHVIARSEQGCASTTTWQSPTDRR